MSSWRGFDQSQIPSEPALAPRVVAGQITGANNDNPNGGAANLGDFDRLAQLVTVRNGCGVNLVMNREAFQKWKALWYAAGVEPAVRVDPATGREFYWHGDARVLVSQHLLNNETKGTGINLTSVYAVVIDTEVGFYGVFKTACPGKFAILEELAKEGVDQRVVRIAANVGFIVTSEKCVARLNGMQAV